MNHLITLIALLVLATLPGVPLQAGLRNQLDKNPSPYLAMHAQDPTAWQRWAKPAIDLARKQNKLLFVSVGYFSCHWCHVMQRESYRDPAIAAKINERFIPVKIDRETEPALDAHLIAFAERTRGYSGWPLNVFLTPEGYPLFATVYLPPKDFLQLLQKLDDMWQTDGANLAKLAVAAQAGGDGPGAPTVSSVVTQQFARQAETVALQIASPMTGGFGDASKFPYAAHLRFLLDRVQSKTGGAVRDFLTLTLDNMANHGLRDHLAGGFFRYTVDPGWKTPHFEKMLYDNAQLAMVYLQAGSLFNEPRYHRVAQSTLDFMRSEMLDRRGAFIAALSAIDANGVEGGYYLWDKQQLEKLLSREEWQVYRAHAGMEEPSPLDDGYLPTVAVPVEKLARDKNMKPVAVQALIDSSRQKMLRLRNQRGLPRDNKLLAGWNGLALSAFSLAETEYPGRGYRETAGRVRDYLVNTLWDGRQLVRARHQGKSMGQASLQDYAGVARGLLDWARLTGKDADYRLAQNVTRQAWRRFYTSRGWRMSEPGLIPMEAPVDAMMDDHMASASATVLDVSLQLARRTRDRQLQARALAALNSGHQLIGGDPFWYVGHIQAMQRSLVGDNQ